MEIPTAGSGELRLITRETYGISPRLEIVNFPPFKVSLRVDGAGPISGRQPFFSLSRAPSPKGRKQK